MAKRKHAADWMLARAREYLSGKGSDRQITRSNGLSGRSLLGWVRKYEEQGEASFMERAGNASCSKKFKASCVRLSSNTSIFTIMNVFRNDLE